VDLAVFSVERREQFCCFRSLGVDAHLELSAGVS
jgi:hypothetical protein